MNLRITHIAIFLLYQFCAHAQNWLSVGSINEITQGSVMSFYADTSTNELFATGSFQFLDTSAAYGIAKWNGTNWVNAFAPTGGYPVYQLTKFQGQYYVTGTGTGDLCKWNGTSWQSAGIVNSGGAVRNLFNDGDSVLYALGSFSSINSISASNVVKFNGVSWSALDNTQWSGGGFSCACRFQGKVYFCGGYNTSLGLYNIFSWDGQNWSSLGAGITGGFQWASALCVFNNELYVGGNFDLSSGNPGNYIARWDGNAWTQVGGGMNGGQVWQLKVFNGELWATGQFSQAGGIGAAYIAKYDGTDWCNVGLFDSPVQPLEAFNGELYVGGNFWTVDGDSVNEVVKWSGNSTGVCGHLNTGFPTSSSKTISVGVFPNPVTESATFLFTGIPETHLIIISDPLGKEVWRSESEQNYVVFNRKDLPSGIYFYRISNLSGLSCTGKLIMK